jgi:adenine specific DNA methylase Mod
VLRLCEFYPGICLTTEEKARKNLSQGTKNLSQGKKNFSQGKENLSQGKKNLSQGNFLKILFIYFPTKRRNEEKIDWKFPDVS